MGFAESSRCIRPRKAIGHRFFCNVRRKQGSTEEHKVREETLADLGEDTDWFRYKYFLLGVAETSQGALVGRSTHMGAAPDERLPFSRAVSSTFAGGPLSSRPLSQSRLGSPELPHSILAARPGRSAARTGWVMGLVSFSAGGADAPLPGRQIRNSR